MVQFSNCAEYNKWNEAQKLVHLCNSLGKDVANILWDYGKETTGSWKGLTEILETRFRGKAMAEKYRLELRNRRCTANETLQSLHSDVRRLAALAYTGMSPDVRDPVTCDHFLDALGDPGLAFKIRERQPADVDSALRIALQLEVWAKEMTRHRDTEKGDGRRVREISTKKPDPAVEALQEEVEDRKKFVGFEHEVPRDPNGDACASSYRQPEVTKHTAPSAYSGVSSAPLSSSGPHPANYGNRAESAHPSNGYGNRNGNFYQAPNPNPGCFNCGDPAHRARNCPVSSTVQRRPDQQSTPPPRPPTQQQPDVRPVKDHSDKQVKTCIWVKYRQHKLSALIDTGSDVRRNDANQRSRSSSAAGRKTQVGSGNPDFPRLRRSHLRMRLDIPTRNLRLRYSK